jgi:hypothetical protein
VPDEDVPAAEGPTRAAPPAPSVQWEVPSKAAPETPPPRITVRRWLLASVVGCLAWFAVSATLFLILRIGYASGVIGLLLGIWVTGRLVGAAGWRRWLLAGALTFGVAAAIEPLIILIFTAFRP